MGKLDKALYYARKQVEHCGVYIWGGQGEKLRKLTVLKLAQMESSAENAARVERFIYTHLKQFDKNTKCFDCSGLVVMALIYAGVLKAGEDLTAQQLYRRFNKVNIKNRTVGDLLFKGGPDTITHVGICISPTEIIEAKGRDYGVVISDIDATWERAARPEY